MMNEINSLTQLERNTRRDELEEWLEEKGLAKNNIARRVYDPGKYMQFPFSMVEMISVIGDSAFTLWTYLARNINHEPKNDKYGYAWPSYNKIEKETDFNRHKIAKALDVLEKNNLLIRHKQFDNFTKYQLLEPLV